MSLARLTPAQFAVLKEISSIGMNHAATALSQLIGETVHLRVPRISVEEIGKIPELLGGAEKVVAGVTLQVLGEARGSILLVFPQESARRLLGLLLRQEAPGLNLGELGSSTLREVGNILASAYLTALGNRLGLSLIPSVPLLACDMAGAVADPVLIELSREGDTALLVETEFFDQSRRRESIQGHFLLLPDSRSLHVLLKAMEEAP